MAATHRARIQGILTAAAEQHAALLVGLPPGLRASLPVDAQGITGAIDHLAQAAGLSAADRRRLIVAHGMNPAVMHARVFGGAPLSEDTVVASFVEGARVRADVLARLADAIGGPELGADVRALLVGHRLPLAGEGLAVAPALRDAYAAQERAAVVIAAFLDDAGTS